MRYSHAGKVARVLGKLYLRFKGFVMWADAPIHSEIRSVIAVVDIWFAWSVLHPLSSARQMSSQAPAFELKLEGKLLTYMSLKRPDVTRIFGERNCRAFRCFFDLSEHISNEVRLNKTVRLELATAGQTIATNLLRIGDEILKQAEASAGPKEAKREWLFEHVRCPDCKANLPELAYRDNALRCLGCGASFPTAGGILDFLPQRTKEEFGIDGAEAISAHGYDDVALSIIEEVRRNGGKVLDCGSGLRSSIDGTVICLDVERLPSVDVLAVNQQLPFCDDVFDAVLSLNVLEHVRNPFVCGAELARVLKPGGALYCCLPFLQPEHGYPSHYFNGTREGLLQLFAGTLTPERSFVPRSGEPIWTLSWFLTSYASGLPPEQRERFLKMRVSEIVQVPTQNLLREQWVLALADESKWELASTTAAIFRKPYKGGM